MQDPENETDETGPDTEINPMYVRHQLCLQSLADLREVEDVEHKIGSTLSCIAAYYDGVSEEILNLYLDFVGIQYADPVVERECRDQINIFHIADLLRIVEPFSDTNWLDPSNEQGFRALMDDKFADFLTKFREESRQFRSQIDSNIEHYISTHE